MGLLRGIKNAINSVAINLGFKNNRESDGTPKELTANNYTFQFSNFDSKKFIEDGYKGNGTIKAMVDYIAEMTYICLTKTGKFYLVNEKGEKTEDDTKLKRINDLIKNPNKKDFKQFVSFSVINLICTGEFIVWLKRRYPDVYLQDIGKLDMPNPVIGFLGLEPPKVGIIGGGVFKEIAGFQHLNTYDNLSTKEIYYSSFVDPYYDETGEPRGLPKLKAVERQIQIDKEALQTQADTFLNRGTNIVISPDTTEILTPDQAREAGEMFNEKYNKASTRGKKTFSSMGIKVHEIGQKLVEMDILSLKVQHIKEYANALGLSGTIFEVGSSGYKSNIESASELSLTIGVIPMVEFFTKFFTEVGNSYQDELKSKVIYEVRPEDAFPELKRIWALYAKNIASIEGISLNQTLEILGMPKSDDVDADEPMVGKNKIFFRDLENMINNSSSSQAPDNNTEL